MLSMMLNLVVKHELNALCIIFVVVWYNRPSMILNMVSIILTFLSMMLTMPSIHTVIPISLNH